MNWTPFIMAAGVFVSILMSILTTVSIGAAAFIAWGRVTQQLRDHTRDDERRFGDVSVTLHEIEKDIKILLQK